LYNQILYIIIIFNFISINARTICQVQKKTIGLGFSSKAFVETDIRDAQAALETWSKELIKTKQIDFDIKVYSYESLQQIEEAVNKGEIGLIILSTIDYVNYRKIIGLEPAITGAYKHEPADTYAVLVNKESGISSTSQLKGKKFVIQSIGRGEIAKIWLETTVLKQHKLTLDKFFNEIKNVKKESQAILQVFFRQMDACITSRRAFETMIELNPQINENLNCIIESPAYIPMVFAFTKSINKEERNEILSLCKDVNKFNSGKQILLFFKQDNVIKYSDSDLANLETLIKENNLLKLKNEKYNK
jgi:ABC-type phosphate/phosphonate transport system substrate-binding protein